MYFNKKLILYRIIFETNIFREGLAAGCKSDNRRVRTKCLWISKGRKSETMAHKNNVEIFSRHNKPEWIILLRRLKSSLEKDALSAGLNMTFYPKPPPLTHRRLKQYQRTKINKTMLSPPSSVFHTKFTISELESK